MNKDRLPINWQTWRSLAGGIRRFAISKQVGGKAKVLLAVLVLFLLGLNGLNVLNSYVSRDFMTAIENRNLAEFMRMTLLYICVFASITVVSVLYSFTEQHLGLLWREWATRQAIGNYANHRVYYRLKLKGEVGNPDQRIADDIRTFSATTLSFVLILLNATFTVIAFSGVLWSISPMLFVVAVLYAALGTLLTFLFGKPLVRLNYDQSDREANFRGALIYLRANAESVALSRREGHLIQLSLKNLGELAANFRRIIAVTRNVGFFTTGYNWLVQIIPALFVAPLFIHGRVEFGVISQSAIAFTHLLGAFSIIVTQFQSISSYTAVLARLSSLQEAGDREKAETLSDARATRDGDRIAYQGLTLCSPRSGRVLIKELSMEIPHGKSVLVRGQDETARASLFQVTGGFWEIKEGNLVRPRLEEVLLVPELPYLPPGTIRELLMKPWPEEERSTDSNLKAIQVPEEEMLEALRALKVESLLHGFGGLDTRHHWENTLPLDEQQLLVLARILLARPRFVFLDRPSTTLSPEQVDSLLRQLRDRDITYVTFEGEEEEHHVNLESYDVILELKEGGDWNWEPTRGGRR
jgi:putative ATP-binding cassette transporter